MTNIVAWSLELSLNNICTERLYIDSILITVQNLIL